MNPTPLLPLLAATVIALPTTASAQQPPADPADVASIDAIMTAVYEVISGDARRGPATGTASAPSSHPAPR